MIRISTVFIALFCAGAQSQEKVSPFLQGVEFYQSGKYEQAEPLLRKAGENSGALGVYQQFFLADTLMQLGKGAEAAPILKGILIQKPTTEIKYRVFFMMSQQAIDKSQWREARSRLQPLAKKWKWSSDYPTVLHRLMRVELKLHNSSQACKWALKLYTRFPTHPLIMGWSSSLHEVDVDGQKMNCQIRTSDFQERVRRLEWAGEVVRARKEIEEARAAAPESDREKYDLIMARFLVSEGLVEDALALLIRSFPKEKSDFNYLSLLGLAAARAGEYQTAVGALEKAYALAPHSKKGREALFQAAFLSYQFQDYDGAVKKFSQLMGDHPRSGLARDAQWHLAWLQYLRSDYEGALKKMAEVRNIGLRSRRFRNSASDQRLLYWMAMSHLRLNQLDEAKTGLELLVHDNPIGYYALAAQARLQQLMHLMTDTKVPRSTSSVPPPVAASPKPAAPAAEEDESEDDMTQAPADDQETDEKEAATESEPLDSSEFKEPALKAHLEAAQQLTALNLTDLARSELWEVERRTSNPVYLKLLITAYEGIGSFHRSASISELNFSGERQRLGVDGAKALWLSAYPQAFKKSVQKSTAKQRIPDEWVWAIMRAESLYKIDTISPVGAKGLMQLMPFTATNLTRLSESPPRAAQAGSNAVDLMDPDVNIALGAQYLARLGQQFQGNLSLVAAAYNAGPHRVQGWLVSFGHLETDEFIEHIPFVETRNYVKKVLLNEYSYRSIYAKDGAPFKWLAEPLGVAIPAKIPTHENWDAI